MIYGDVPQSITPSKLIPNPLAMAQSGNLYAYTVNNPLKYIDPTGLNCEDDEDAVSALAEAIANWFITDGPEDFFRSIATQTRWGYTTVNPTLLNLGRGFQGIGYLLITLNAVGDFDVQIQSGVAPTEAAVNLAGRATFSFAGAKAGTFATSWIPIPGARLLGVFVGTISGSLAGSGIYDTLADLIQPEPVRGHSFDNLSWDEFSNSVRHIWDNRPRWSDRPRWFFNWWD